MEKDPQVVARLATEREDENWRFRTFVKNLPSHRQKQINVMAVELGRDAEAQMDCQSCGACCRDNIVPVTDEEVDRLAGRLSLPVLDFRAQFVTARDEDEGLPAIDATPCSFLQGNSCSVYEDRPDPCRGYPYLGKDMASRMVAVIERGGACPIVFEMLEQLKARIGFHGYSQKR